MQDTRSHGLLLSKRFKLSKGTMIRFEAPVAISSKLVILSGTSIGAYTTLHSGRINNLKSIGRYCSIGSNVSIGEMGQPQDWLSTSAFQYKKDRFGWYDEAIKQVAVGRTKEQRKEINSGVPIIANDVCIAANVCIMRGVKIGNGAIVEAGAVVNRDVEPFEIVGGAPIRHIGYRFSIATRKRLIALKWWKYDCRSFVGVDFRNVEKALDQIEAGVEAGTILPMEPQWKIFTGTEFKSVEEIE